MHLAQYVIDDFLPDPGRVRRAALALSYPPRPERATYPGRNADKALNLGGLDAMISDIVRERVKPIPNYSHCVPRLALAGDVAGTSVHIDMAHWSGIVYLSKDEHCRDGTHFFRHKATGWDRAPVFPGEPQKAGYRNGREAIMQILDAGQHDLDQWEKTMTVPMRYNRLALFRSYMWHDAGESFGDSPETGRLILPFFFETIMS